MAPMTSEIAQGDPLSHGRAWSGKEGRGALIFGAGDGGDDEADRDGQWSDRWHERGIQRAEGSMLHLYKVPNMQSQVDPD